ncbi:amidase [Veronia pacifica]|uniref:Amidase n=1 Tax=Veronia pacifica TaxID=1080227 RepID=A0A1C3EPG6_9GAMM|nr:amidase [Veronia pacifica]ODA35131.1 amidase [Veronia pacifica]
MKKQFVAAAVGLLLSASSIANVVPALEEANYDQLKQYLNDGSLNSEQLVSYYLDRIQALDKTGPTLNSILALNPDAIERARELDKERSAGKVRGPLHGMPVVLKDNIDTRAPLATTAGALALKDNVKAQAAPLVEQLEAAGAIVLGKANLSEWAYFKAFKASSGYSQLGGQTKNPYVLDRNPCGSSSGSAVSVSANLTLFAVGTETDGSIVCPASSNGIVGIKPTVGLIPSEGIVPISHSQDSAGPMARTVKDAAILLGVMANPDNKKREIDYADGLSTVSLKGKRIGVTQHADRFPEPVKEVFEQALKNLEAEGAVLVRGVALPQEEALGKAEFEVLLHEFKHDLNAYLSTTPDAVKVKSIDQLVAFNKANPSTIELFKQELIEMSASKGSLKDEAYTDAVSTIQKYGKVEGLDKVVADLNLDALVAPTNTPSWKTDHENGDKFIASSSSPAAIVGYPSITVPMGDVDGLPLGISFFGLAYSEKSLIDIAYAFEKSNNARIVPTFKPTLVAKAQ